MCKIWPYILLFAESLTFLCKSFQPERRWGLPRPGEPGAPAPLSSSSWSCQSERTCLLSVVSSPALAFSSLQKKPHTQVNIKQLLLSGAANEPRCVTEHRLYRNQDAFKNKNKSIRAFYSSWVKVNRTGLSYRLSLTHHVHCSPSLAWSPAAANDPLLTAAL